MGRTKASKQERKDAKTEAFGKGRNSHMPVMPPGLVRRVPGRAPPNSSMSAQQTAELLADPVIQRQRNAANAAIQAIEEMVDGVNGKRGELKKKESEPEQKSEIIAEKQEQKEMISQGTQTELKPTWRQRYYMPYLVKN